MKKPLKLISIIAVFSVILFGSTKGRAFYKSHKPPKEQSKPLHVNTSQKAFVILISAHNNANLCEKCLFSALTQQYENFRIIYIDDASTDDSFSLASRLTSLSTLKDKVTLIQNSTAKGSLSNLYTTIQNCENHEIIVPVEGNDFLAHEKVLLKLNKAYAKPSTWMTYGNFLEYPSYRQSPVKSKPISKSIIFNNAFRSHDVHDTYLKTFYAALFKQIKKEDLLFKGKFLPSNGSLAYFLPLLELSGKHAIFINDILYLHSTQSNSSLSKDYVSYMRTLPKYTRLKMLKLDEKAEK
jgi:glycosyltransferase involved in cell wall biosynthesis